MKQIIANLSAALTFVLITLLYYGRFLWSDEDEGGSVGASFLECFKKSSAISMLNETMRLSALRTKFSFVISHVIVLSIKDPSFHCQLPAGQTAAVPGSWSLPAAGYRRWMRSVR